jgi:hypothetical protein
MSSSPARSSAAAVLALNGSAAGESYCGKPRRAGKSRPMSRESGGCRIMSLCPSRTVKKRDGRHHEAVSSATPRHRRPPSFWAGLSAPACASDVVFSPDLIGVLGR